MLEELIVQAVVPIARKIKEEAKLKSNEIVIARNLVMKIGTRILYRGTPGVDDIISGKTKGVKQNEENKPERPTTG